jgi:hypothetical protein
VSADRQTAPAATEPRYDEFREWVASALVRHPEWRHGQACFNVLYEDFDPALANRIRGRDLDPFYNDGRIPAFLEAVKSAWA